jgi:hypothetical protein
MTVLLVLFFISIALLADYWREEKRVKAPKRARAPSILSDLFVHDNGLLPTMADGGTIIEKKPTEDPANVGVTT